MNGLPLSRNQVVAALLVRLLVASAGCSGLGGDGGDAETTDAPDAPGATNGTADENGTDDGNATEDDADDGGATDDGDDPAATGRMAVVVDGTRLDIDDAYEGPAGAFRVPDGAHDTYRLSRENATVADALATLGVDATDDSITYGNETYVDGENATVTVRVNGQPVDPTTHELSAGDEVWVVVETPDTEPPVPGDHISHDDLHVHGDIAFEVDGETVDFSEDRYQNPDHSEHFHFEGGAANPWHAHSWSVTLGYAMSTLDGIEVTEDAVTYGNETYADGENATVNVTVNGEPVDPDEYVLKDGDSVRIVVDSDA